MLILGLNGLTRPPWGRRALFLCYPNFSSVKSLDLSYLLVVLTSLSRYLQVQVEFRRESN